MSEQETYEVVGRPLPCGHRRVKAGGVIYRSDTEDPNAQKAIVYVCAECVR